VILKEISNQNQHIRIEVLLKIERILMIENLVNDAHKIWCDKFSIRNFEINIYIDMYSKFFIICFSIHKLQYHEYKVVFVFDLLSKYMVLNLLMIETMQLVMIMYASLLEDRSLDDE
jgi:hypothetical protein